MTNQKVFIIAEAGVNHNGSLKLAKQMVDRAADTGVDAIKFQSFKTEDLVLGSSPKANYQLQNTASNESQFQMLKKLELSKEAQQQLFDYCLKKDIGFLSSPFDMESCSFLIETLGLKTIKLGSGELTNAQLLYYIAQQKVNIILSTGMSNIAEIKKTLALLAFAYTNNGENIPCSENFHTALKTPEGIHALEQYVKLLHCTTEYPCPVDEVNLNVISTLSKYFTLPVGYSDHTQGFHISLAAVAMGATIIEKHFTLDRNLPGPDHKSSIEPDELSIMVKQIRDIEKGMGISKKQASKSELKNRPIARKGIYARGNINKGEILTADNICVKRPEAKTSALLYWDILGKKADKNYKNEDPI